MTKILLTDNSHWEGTIDWKTAAPNMGGAINKASEHISFVDDQWGNNKAGCIAQGEPFGAYHFFRPSYDPLAQSQHFVSTVGKGVKVLACDVETAILEIYNQNQPATKSIAIDRPRHMAAIEHPDTQAFAEIIRSELAQVQMTYSRVGMIGSAKVETLSLPQMVEQFLDYVIVQVPDCRPVFYSSPCFWKEHMKYANGSYPNWNGRYFLWEAHYGVEEPAAMPPWIGYEIHQFTDKQSIPGIQSLTDGDHMNRTQSEVNTFFGAGSLPPIPPTLPDKVIINTPSLNIRSSPDARLANIIGSTPLNKIWNPTSLVSGFDLNGKAAEFWQINKYAFIAKWLTKW